jgi:hypothetical protein
LSYGRSRYFTILFSYKKYPESDLVRITKVVVFSTMNPTNLVWHFSRIFLNLVCQLCLLLKNHSYDQTLRTFQCLTNRSLVHTKHPAKISSPAIGSLAAGGCGLARNPAAPAALPVGERLGVKCRLT